MFNVPSGSSEKVKEAITKSLQWLDFKFEDEVKVLVPSAEPSLTARKVSLRYAPNSAISADQVLKALEKVPINDVFVCVTAFVFLHVWYCLCCALGFAGDLSYNFCRRLSEIYC